MVTIKITKKATPLVSSFSNKVWKTADLQYSGRIINWKKEVRFIHAYTNKQLVGLIELTMEAGVMIILDLAIDYTYQNQGIGTILMHRAEKLAKQHKVHKISLETGKTWKVRKFYEKLGYIKTGDLLMHFAKQDYVQYSKFLSL
jgi:ribosomal protein S18 acetylase RimI-like enzyme